MVVAADGEVVAMAKSSRGPRASWRAALYGHSDRAEHRVVASDHGQRPQFSRKVLRWITRVFRNGFEARRL